MTSTANTVRSRGPEGATAWRDAAPWPGSPERDMGQCALGPEGTTKALRVHFAAMAYAHLNEYGARIVNRELHCADCETRTQPHAGQYLRDLIRDHYEPAVAAFAAAAALSGWSAERIVRIVEDAASMHEWICEWLPETVALDDIAPASTPIPAAAPEALVAAAPPSAVRAIVEAALPEIVLAILYDTEGDTPRWVMAHGHHDRDAFRAAAVDFLDIDEADRAGFPAAEMVAHCHAVNSKGIDNVDVEWVGVTESTPGAFPVTLLDLDSEEALRG